MSKSDFEKMVDARLGAMREEAVREMATEYLKTGIDTSIPLAEFVNGLHKEGLWDLLKDLPLKEIFGVMFGAAAPAEKKGEGRRLTKADKDRLLEAIPAFLAKNPWSKRSDIARNVGMEPRKMNVPLRELVRIKKIKKQGEKAGVVYAVAGEKEKP